LAALSRDVQTKHRDLGGPLPLLALQHGQFVAAAYFKRLPGNVATLGGVRAADSFANVAVSLVTQLNDTLRSYAIPQIQAIVDVADPSTADIVGRSGFDRLTTVQHLALDLASAQPAAEDRRVNGAGVKPMAIHWLPATHLAKSRVERLIDATFVGTLDCPALNELRQQPQVLEGMLDGRDFRRVASWDLLVIDRELVGCVFLSEHPPNVAELAYMGLVPAARGKKLGHELMKRAMERSKLLGSCALLAAVDENNTPAIKLYSKFGFRCQQKLSVWLLPN
jgi:ribosomal protein S18 acetylase RimI-like enzyme